MTKIKSNTATRITNEARLLFNKSGIAAVTIRKIALTMGISTGNLNYHFKRRQDIVEHLYFEMVKEFDKPIDNLDSLEFTIQKLYHASLSNFKRMVDYRFIWVDLHQTLRESKKIKQHFLETRRKRTHAYRYMISRFIDANLMSKEQYTEEHQMLIKRLIDFTDFWISSERLMTNKLGKQQINESHQIFMSVFYPYLTSKGKNELKKCFDLH